MVRFGAKKVRFSSPFLFSDTLDKKTENPIQCEGLAHC